MTADNVNALRHYSCRFARLKLAQVVFEVRQPIATPEHFIAGEKRRRAKHAPLHRLTCYFL